VVSFQWSVFSGQWSVKKLAQNKLHKINCAKKIVTKKVVVASKNSKRQNGREKSCSQKSVAK